MSSTSQKHRNFVSESMGDKSVAQLAGIGPVYGKRLADAGFDKAYKVLGKYLLLGKDAQLFKSWLENSFQLSSKWANDCYECINEWCLQFL